MQLTLLQHVVAGSSNTNLGLWRFPDGSGIPPLHLLPARMEPDAVESDLAMQVGPSSIGVSPTVFTAFKKLTVTCDLPSSISLIFAITGSSSVHYNVFLV